MAKTETFSDNFDDNSLSGSWSTSTDVGVTITETGGQLQISLPNSSPAYGTIQTFSAYDLTDSFVRCQLVNAGSQTNMDCLPIYISDGGTGNNIFWNVSGGTCVAHTFIGGVDADRGTNFTYNSALHKFFMIKEVAGTIYWLWSRDGKGWATHASIATSLTPITSVGIGMQAGFFGAPGTTTIASFDNFNFSGRASMPINNLRPHPFSPGIAR